MDIRNTRELKTFAAQRLSNAREEKRIVLIYAGLALGLSALVTIINYVLDLQISQFGGLGNIGTRTILSSLQTITPIILSLVTMCLDLGYIAAMLRIARGQYVSPQTLRLGFDRFWVLLRCMIVKGLILVVVVFASVYLGLVIYLVSPLSNSAMELLTPYLSDLSALESGMMLDEAVYAQITSAVVPAYVICGVLLCIFAAPVMYSYRMTDYIIIDKPAMGAMAALRESKKMMKGNRFRMFRLDLSMWWYYGAQILISLICYGDVILPMLGIELLWSEDVTYFLFFALYLALQFAAYFYLRNRVEVTYGLAYDAVKPEEKQSGGIVLGNIFDM